jgi:hypothetical protein
MWLKANIRMRMELTEYLNNPEEHEGYEEEIPTFSILSL